jgi:hypothetical protein
MPCRGPDDLLSYDQLRAQRDKLTRMLCATLERTNVPAELPDVAAWWAEHQRLDRERREAAAAWAKEQAERDARDAAMEAQKARGAEALRELLAPAELTTEALLAEVRRRGLEVGHDQH